MNNTTKKSPQTKGYLQRFTTVILALALYAFGHYLAMQANIGLAPWDAFHIGVGYVSGLSTGTVVVLSGVTILVIDILLGERIGWGSILNALLIGTFLDVYFWLDFIPPMESLWLGLPMLFAGLLSIVLATYFYVSAGMGCGPRDALMVALSRIFPRFPVGLIRTCIEGTVLCIGWLCGAKIGIGTVAAVFGIGFLVEFVFKALRFDVKAVAHETIFDTLAIWRGKGK